MSDALAPARRQPTDWKTQAMQRRIRRRYAAERRFRLMGLAAIVISAGFLVFLLVTMLGGGLRGFRSEEHTSELQSLMRISYAVFCLQQKKHTYNRPHSAS